MAEMLTGGCLCGAVRYRISVAPVEAQYCHCRMCRLAHGAPVVAWLTVPIAGFELTAGAPTGFRSSAKAYRHFCGTCGTPLTWRQAERPRHIDISIGSLDEPERAPPTLHVWTDSQIAWFHTADELPRHPKNDRQRPYS